MGERPDIDVDATGESGNPEGDSRRESQEVFNEIKQLGYYPRETRDPEKKSEQKVPSCRFWYFRVKKLNGKRVRRQKQPPPDQSPQTPKPPPQTETSMAANYAAVILTPMQHDKVSELTESNGAIQSVA